MDLEKIFTCDAYLLQPELDEYTRTAWALLAAEGINNFDHKCEHEGNFWRFDGLIEGRYSFVHPKHPASGHVLYFKILPATIERARREYRQQLEQRQKLYATEGLTNAVTHNALAHA